jgi:hypothetical protein
MAQNSLSFLLKCCAISLQANNYLLPLDFKLGIKLNLQQVLYRIISIEAVLNWSAKYFLLTTHLDTMQCY